MPATIDLTGQRFGRLVVRLEVGRTRGGICWRCECDCGEQIEAISGHLRHGTRSCGCLKRDQAAQVGRRKRPRHGHAGRGQKTRAYHSWEAMIQRCTNPHTKAFKNYGGRGITICDRWRRSFEAFLADMGEPPDGHTLDRKNNDGCYEPDNCRWATRAEQKLNQRPRGR